jgi:hypothetical protein
MFNRNVAVNLIWFTCILKKFRVFVQSILDGASNSCKIQVIIVVFWANMLNRRKHDESMSIHF